MTVNICGVIIAFTAQKETEACFSVVSTTYVFITFKFWNLHADVIIMLFWIWAQVSHMHSHTADVTSLSFLLSELHAKILLGVLPKVFYPVYCRSLARSHQILSELSCPFLYEKHFTKGRKHWVIITVFCTYILQSSTCSNISWNNFRGRSCIINGRLRIDCCHQILFAGLLVLSAASRVFYLTWQSNTRAGTAVILEIK